MKLNNDRKLRKILSISERIQKLINEGVDLFIRERPCLRRQTYLKKAGESFEMEKLENKIAMNEAVEEMLRLTRMVNYEEKKTISFL